MRTLPELYVEPITDSCGKGQPHQIFPNNYPIQELADFEQAHLAMHYIEELDGFNSTLAFTVTCPESSSMALIIDHGSPQHVQFIIRGAAEASNLLSSLMHACGLLKAAGVKPVEFYTDQLTGRDDEEHRRSLL